MKIKELISTMEEYGFTPYQFNKDEAGDFVLEDGISFAINGENIIEILFPDKNGDISGLVYEPDPENSYPSPLDLELTEDIDQYIHNFLKLVIKDIDYVADNMIKFAMHLKEVSKCAELLESKGLLIEVEENYVHFKGRKAIYSISAKYNDITQEFRWVSRESLLVDPDTILEDLIEIAKEQELPQYRYLYDPEYTEGSVWAIAAATQFIRAVEKDENVNQGVQYGEILDNYFELKDIPSARQDLIDKVTSRSYTQKELNKYGYFKRDIYGSPVEVDSIQ